MNHFSIAFIFAVSVSLFLAVFSFYTDYYPFLNDFWGNYYLSLTLRFDDISTLYNAFFPIGYSVALRTLHNGGNPAVNAMYMNIILIFALYLSLSQLSQTLQLKKQTFIIALVLITLFPRLLLYYNTVGADIGAMTFFSIGAIISVSALKDDRQCIWKFIGCGALWGLAALWRYHAFLGALLILLSYFVVFRERRKALFISLFALLIVYLPQLGINIVVGDSFQDNIVVALVYKFMYGINWYRLSEIDLPQSTLALIMQDPVIFITRYLRHSLLLLIPLSLPPLICFLFASGFNRKVSLCWFVFTAFYSLAVAISDSQRAVLLPLPISLLFASYALTLITEQYVNRRLVTGALKLMLAAYLVHAVYGDVRHLSYQQSKSARYKDVESLVVANEIASSFDVYTTDHDAYFRNIRPFRPAFSGSWIRVGTFIDEWLFKEPSLESLDKFIADCKRYGFKLLYLVEGSEKAAHFLEDIRVGAVKNNNLRLIKKYNDASLFVVI